MKGSTTSSGKRGGLYKDSTHSSEADSVDKWRHDGFDQLQRERQEQEQTQTYKKQTSEFNNSFKDDTQSTIQQNQAAQNYQAQGNFKKPSQYKKQNYHQYSQWDEQSKSNYSQYPPNDGQGGNGKMKRSQQSNNSQFYQSESYNQKKGGKHWQRQNNGGQPNYQGQYPRNSQYAYGKTYGEGSVRNLKQNNFNNQQPPNQTADSQRKKGHNNNNNYKKDKQQIAQIEESQEQDLPQKNGEDFSKEEDPDKLDQSSQNSGTHRQIYYQNEENKMLNKNMKQRLLYVVNLKINDMKIQIDISENDNVQELLDQCTQQYKLSKELQEALYIHINRKVEQILQEQQLQADLKKEKLKAQQNNQLGPNQILDEQKANGAANHLNQMAQPYQYNFNENNFINAQNLNFIQQTGPTIFAQPFPIPPQMFGYMPPGPFIPPEMYPNFPMNPAPFLNGQQFMQQNFHNGVIDDQRFKQQVHQAPQHQLSAQNNNLTPL